MLWMWISLTILITFITWLAAAARFRSSIIRSRENLRALARDLRQQAQHLSSVREAERESKRDAHRKIKEVSTLRGRNQTLTSTLNTVSAERDSLRSRNDTAETRISELTERLAVSEAKVTQLVDDVEAASRMRWKLISRIHNDAAERELAWRQLQKPYQALPPLPAPTSTTLPRAGSTPALSTSQGEAGSSSDQGHLENVVPSVKTPNLPNSSENDSAVTKPSSTKGALGARRRIRNDDDIVRVVARDLNRSVSIDDLLALKPDISAAPEEDDSSSRMEDVDMGLGVAQDFPLQANTPAKDNEKSLPLSLDRAPWVDTVNPTLNTDPSSGSIATALEPPTSMKRSGWVLSGMRDAAANRDVLA